MNSALGATDSIWLSFIDYLHSSCKGASATTEVGKPTQTTIVSYMRSEAMLWSIPRNATVLLVFIGNVSTELHASIEFI